ncbi:MAG: hypothetical protein N2253_06160 [Bacteroidia bacterium]|nr:hypothetical protein [Bacteroidia bacterium]MCX7764455.1 hypothetical protein [Bacteroidia bacterium]MDW8057063.1 hypothetical protein [Bacteroidia bacterium]
MTGCRLWLWGVLGWLSLGAQPPKKPAVKDTLLRIDSAITPFEEHQQTILRLIAYHQPELDTIEAHLRGWRDTLNQMMEIARYPKRLPFYVDSFRVVTGRIRAQSEAALARLKDMHFEWLPHQYALMAVYTRFGELKVVQRLTPSVRETLVAYRQYLDKFNQLTQKIAAIWTDCDYLLLSKLK